MNTKSINSLPQMPDVRSALPLNNNAYIKKSIAFIVAFIFDEEDKEI